MERVKYSPVIKSDEATTIATSITLSFHFRERNRIFVASGTSAEDKEKELKERKQNTPFTSGNVYTDGWYINTDSGATIWWNGLECNDSGFSNTVADFIEESGLTSDLIGYLNFTDNDIYYRKKKVSQSFIRLTFYNSTDPIEQKLLYYSTIFLDAGELYGKYIKQLMYMEENDLFNKKKNQGLNLNAAVVFCSANTENRVDSKIVITNEYNRTKSSEGFNIYLFAEDINFNIDENGVKTIYMKVEFNHAGYGRTIPFMFPRSGGGILYDFGPNFPTSFNGDWKQCNEMQYFPVILNYDSELNEYVYYFPYGKTENNTLVFNLYEPRINSLE